MDEFFDIPTLIVIGVAIVVLFRLRQVLGTRVGHQRPPVDPARPEADAKPEDTVLTLRQRPADPKVNDDELRARKLEAEIEQLAHGDTGVAEGLNAIAAADRTFSPKAFLEGAKQAYEMVLTAYAGGDRKTLKNLLEKDVYDGFDHAMAEREAQGNKVDFTFVGLPKVEISHAEFDRRNGGQRDGFACHVRDAQLLKPLQIGARRFVKLHANGNLAITDGIFCEVEVGIADRCNTNGF